MKIAKTLGLSDEIFCRMVITTKMLFSNVLGHAAELHYEKYLKFENINFKKAPTDVHFDYVINRIRDQVKRWETDTTDNEFIGVNLTKTHGNRIGPDAFYTKNAFDRLILFDVGFRNFESTKINNISENSKYSDRLPGKFKIKRNPEQQLTKFEIEFLKTLKNKNNSFPTAIEKLRNKYHLSYPKLLEKTCNLTLSEIDSLFSEDNFRLITGAKGFAAEEHFNVLLEKHKIPYKQDKEMYSKVDHWVRGKIRVQVKTPNERANTEKYFGFKTHKSHGHGKGELYSANVFDVVALFIGFKMNHKISKYLPVSVSNEFILIPSKDLPRHNKYKDCLKRVTKIKKGTYKINDLRCLQMNRTQLQ